MADEGKQAHFVPQVESLRGLAEFPVEYSHIFGVLISPIAAAGLLHNPLTNFALDWLSTIFSAEAAVSLFSVISGFVLGRMLDAADGGFGARTWGAFVWRRLWRLLPVHIVVLLLVLSVWGAFVAGRPVDLSAYPMLQSTMGEFINAANLPRLDAIEFIRNIFFLSISINPVSWYLNIELMICLIFPLLHWLGRRESVWIDLAILLPVLVATAIWNPSFAKPFFFLVYLPGFYLGLLVDSWGAALARHLRRRELFASLLAIGAYLLMARLLHWIPGKSAIRIHIEVFAATGLLTIIVWALPRWLAVVLRLPLLRWLGKICYSTYLIHCLFLILLFRAAIFGAPELFYRGGLWFVFGGLALVVVTTFIVASGMFVWIELPAMRLGQAILRQMPSRSPVDGKALPL